MFAGFVCGLAHLKSEGATILLVSHPLERKEAGKGPLPVVAIFATTMIHVSQLTHQRGTNSPLSLDSESWT